MKRQRNYLDIYKVDASRLVDSGGDIRASYSADIISMDGRIRKPFRWQERPFIATSFSGSECEAYRVVPSSSFEGTPTTYRQKTGTEEGAEIARQDPNGFYHGMAVKSGKETLILCGPPAKFIVLEDTSRDPEQMTLFEKV